MLIKGAPGIVVEGGSPGGGIIGLNGKPIPGGNPDIGGNPGGTDVGRSPPGAAGYPEVGRTGGTLGRLAVAIEEFELPTSPPPLLPLSWVSKSCSGIPCIP